MTTICPYCGAHADAATRVAPRREKEDMPGGSAELSGRPPTPGSVSICIKCAEYSLFDDDLKLRRPLEIERLKIELSNVWPTICAAQNFIKQRRSAEDVLGFRPLKSAL